MCGRARLSSDVSEIKLVFSIPPERPAPNIPANWNAAPTEDLPVVRYDARAGERSLDTMRWGLVPFWAKDIKLGFANINAKAEGIEIQVGHVVDAARTAVDQRRRAISGMRRRDHAIVPRERHHGPEPIVRRNP